MEKPILFNTAMVQAILKGNKTCTRRIIKLSGHTPSFYGRDKFYKLVDNLNEKTKLFAGFYKDSDVFEYEGKTHTDAIYFKAPYQVGDILYVRETFANNSSGTGWPYDYKASPKQWEFNEHRWHPSIHMPKKAARLFLKVTDVRVEMIMATTAGDCVKEGIKLNYQITDIQSADEYIHEFRQLWDSIYNNWNDNPWVWVIEFEKIEGE